MENCETNNNGNLERKVEHILITKTKLVYGIIVATLIVGSLFFKIQLDVALIKQNHETHMEKALTAIEELKKEQGDLMKQLNTDHDAIIKLLTIHKKELGD